MLAACIHAGGVMRRRDDSFELLCGRATPLRVGADRRPPNPRLSQTAHLPLAEVADSL